MALIEIIGGGGVVSALWLTRVYLPRAKPGEEGRKNGEKGEKCVGGTGGVDKKKKGGKKAQLCFAPVGLRAPGHLSRRGGAEGGGWPRRAHGEAGWVRKPTGGTERRGAPAGRGGPLSRWVRVPGAGMRAGRERRSPLLLSGVAARPMGGCCVRRYGGRRRGAALF